MNLKELESDVNSLIQAIDQILLNEDFSAYHRVKQSLLKTKTLIQDNELQSALKEIGLSFRLISEAPPKDKSLSLSIFHALDKLYKELNR